MEPVDRALVFGHEYVARLVTRNPRKYIGFMPLDPSHPDAIRQMEQGAREFGLKGIKLYLVMSLYNPADPQLHPFFQKAVELGLPILTHIGTSPISAKVRGALPEFGLNSRTLVRLRPGSRLVRAEGGVHIYDKQTSDACGFGRRRFTGDSSPLRWAKPKLPRSGLGSRAGALLTVGVIHQLDVTGTYQS